MKKILFSKPRHPNIASYSVVRLSLNQNVSFNFCQWSIYRWSCSIATFITKFSDIVCYAMILFKTNFVVLKKKKDYQTEQVTRVRRFHQLFYQNSDLSSSSPICPTSADPKVQVGNRCFSEGCRVAHVHRGLLPSTGLNFTPVLLPIYLAGPWKCFCRAWSVNCCTRPGSSSPLCQDQRRPLVAGSAWCLVEQERISQTWGFRLSWRCWWPKASVYEDDHLEIVKPSGEFSRCIPGR